VAHPLDTAKLKLDRAKEHLAAFDDEWGDWAEKTDFCRFAPQDDQSNRIYSLEIIATPPAHLSAVLGDCIQNLRASLDYLVWELAPAQRRTTRDKLSFPIHREPPKRGRHFHPKCIEGLNPAAIAIIEELQPYYGGKNPETDLLFFVKELSNVDKHRSIHVVIGQVTVTAFRLYMDFGGDVRMFPPAWHEPGVLNHGAKVAEYPLVALQGGEEVKVEAETFCFATLGNELPWGALSVEHHIGRAWLYIRDEVLPRFERFF